ncbi:MAG: AGE family epimerase/isomerase [Phycicoccus sp.]
MSTVAAHGGSWLDSSAHADWLRRGFADVIRFASRSIRDEGGFHWLDADGSPLPGRRPMLFLTARMAHTSALGVRHGIPGSGELLDHAMASLLGLHVDPVHGGWLTEPGALTRKSAYDHVHVGLAAATAMAVQHPSAAMLFDQVAEVVDARFWDADAQMVRESFADDWGDLEQYGGANANMHGVEAFLAMGLASDDAEWHRRALAVAERLVHGFAREHDWLLPEHYTADWRPLLDYNRDQPEHPFRPYGATLGHSLEWARFLLELDRSPLVESPPWLVEAADALARRALDGGWSLDGRPGLVYTVGWGGEVVAGIRLHWPVCEGIQAAAALRRHTGDPHWEGWYRRLWDHAARWWVDDRGTWRGELDDSMVEAGTVWPGRPDVYHCGGALLGPLDLLGAAAPT